MVGHKPTIPCIECGQLLWPGPGTLPDDQRVCRACKRRRLPVPEVGQVWVSADPRRPRERLEVVAILDGQVIFRELAERPRRPGSRERRVRVDRLASGSRGFELEQRRPS